MPMTKDGRSGVVQQKRLEKGHAIPHEQKALAKGEGSIFFLVYIGYHDRYWGLNCSRKKKRGKLSNEKGGAELEYLSGKSWNVHNGG